MLGYSLTGLTREHALFFLYGLGANGKSVMINTVIGILAGITAQRLSRCCSHRSMTVTPLN